MDDLWFGWVEYDYEGCSTPALFASEAIALEWMKAQFKNKRTKIEKHPTSPQYWAREEWSATQVAIRKATLITTKKEARNVEVW